MSVKLYDPEDVVDRLSLLIRINSVNPAQGGPGEGLFTNYLRTTLKALGLKLVSDEIEPGRFNLYAMWDVGSDSWDVIDIHADTVTEGEWTGAFNPEVRDGYVYGRGACDVKVNWAMVLCLLESMKRHELKPKHNVLFAATIDEEVGFKGARGLLAWLRKNSVAVRRLLIAEPTRLFPMFGHRGGLAARVILLGEEAHSAVPELGVNAIEWGAECITALRKLRKEYEQTPTTSLLGNSTITTTLAKGGVGQNVVPERFWFNYVARIGGSHTVEAIRADVLRVVTIAAQAADGPAPKVEFKEYGAYPPVLGDAQGEFLSWFVERTKRPAGVVNFGTNGFGYGTQLTNNLVIFGPGDITDAHTDQERVSIDETMEALDILADMLGVH